MKPTRGSYIAFSELYDRRPTKDELLSLVKRMPLEPALILLIRMNLSLRYVLEEPGQSNFGKLQGLLANTFCDKTTFERLIARFGSNQADRNR